MQILTPSQRRQVEELAQQEGFTCPRCGSSELVSENRAQISFGGVHDGKRYNAEVNLELGAQPSPQNCHLSPNHQHHHDRRASSGSRRVPLDSPIASLRLLHGA